MERGESFYSVEANNKSSDSRVRRHRIVMTENHLNNYKPIRPGNNTYSESVKNRAEGFGALGFYASKNSKKRVQQTCQ